MVAVASFGVHAASVNLKVTAKIVPGSCTPVLSGGGIVDYGSINSTSVLGNANGLGERKLDFSMDCTAKMPVALRFIDNRVGTAELSNVPYSGLTGAAFGLGTSGGKKIGLYTVKLLDFTDGGKKVIPALFQLGNEADAIVFNGIVNPNQTVTWSSTGFGATPVQKVKGQIEVNAWLDKTLDLKTEVQLDGSATIEVLYL